MAITNPRVHIICGMCGCSTMMKYYVRKDINDNTNKVEHKVYIVCENCSTLSGLDEIIRKEEKPSS